jgi:hypothetical protein
MRPQVLGATRVSDQPSLSELRLGEQVASRARAQSATAGLVV